MKRLDRIKKLREEATQYPWRLDCSGDGENYVMQGGTTPNAIACYITEKDGALIAAAPTELEWLEGWARRAEPWLRDFDRNVLDDLECGGLDNLIDELEGE